MTSQSPPRHAHNLIDDSPLDAGTPLQGGRLSPPIYTGSPHRRVSFNQPVLRPSQGVPLTRTFTGGSKAIRDEEALLSPGSARPPIPNALPMPGAQAVYSTPLPILPMIVLSITMLSEFLSANVCTPFLLFMVEGFMNGDNEADVGYWTGILVSMFFLTQFLTSLLWATVADRHGQRIVLFVSLLGSALTCLAFGTSSSLAEALTIRLMQGIFGGSIGVARSSITSITDGSNEGRAYAILGFCWGIGGVAGAIIGGTFESPVKKWPDLFARTPLFVRFPYLLPCAMAASVTFTGAILSLFLARDGGPRDGSIRLPIVKEEAEPTRANEDTVDDGDLVVDADASPSSDNIVTRLRKKVSRQFSGIFARRVLDAQGETSSSSDPVPLSQAIPIPRRSSRTGSSRTSRANGSAYGYGGYRTRLPSSALTLRRGSTASAARRRRGTFGDGGGAGSGGTSYEGSNFAQRLLMANEMAVTNIADLWVAAAINVDNDDVFISDDEAADEITDDDQEGRDIRSETEPSRTFTPPAMSRNPLEIRRTRTADTTAPTNPLEIRRTLTAEPTAPRHSVDMQRTSTIDSVASRSSVLQGRDSHTPRLTSTLYSPSSRYFSGQYSTPSRGRLSALVPNLRNSPHEGLVTAGPQLRPRPSRAFSTTSQLPSIYANAGVRAPLDYLSDPPVPLQASFNAPAPYSDGVDPFQETTRQPQPQIEEKPPSAFNQLPLMIILQYGLLALHTTTHDQIFLSYLVSPYRSGGLGLNAAHFAQLIALMCLAQIAYQFYIYPPPRGRFSHLSMFRLGSLLFIPAYASVTLYRVFASEGDDGNLILMALLAISTAVRYCGSTFSYTAVSILLNYMSPPPVVGLANGLAQSIVSLARFAGPVLGGYLWSASVKDNPSGYPLGFFICSGACALAILHSFVIR